MIRIQKTGDVFLCVCCMAFCATADVGISVNGTVKNGEDVAIAGASVMLVSDTSMKSATNASGEFSISGSVAIRSGGVDGFRAPTINDVDIRNNRLRFSVASPVKNAVAAIFSGSGKRHAFIPFGRMDQGLHTRTLPELSPGFYVTRITIDQSVMTRTLVNTGNGIFISDNISEVKSASGAFRSAAAQNVDTLVVKKDGFTTVRQPIASYKQTGVAIVMERTKFGPVTAKDLPVIKEMPDPLIKNNGTKVTTLDQWKVRRREMIRILEDYEYGHMPPPPGNVKATVATALSRITVSGTLQADYRMMRLTFGLNEKQGFDLGIFTPVDTMKRYPVLINIGYSAPKQSSLGAASAALSRGYAVANINYTQLGADNANYRSSAFFPSYPEYDWRDFSAWAWGVSRVVDYLVTDSAIDREKIMVTGTSRCGQAALLAGAFDERIALTAPVAGGMALRFSGKEMGGGLGQGITEVVDQGTYWFGPNFEKFRNQTPRLPCDQHWLPALAAPRLFILLNSLSDEYGRAYAAVQTYLAAKPVYEFLGTTDNLGLNFRAGGHGMFAEDWSALLDFADQKLLKKAGTRKFDVIPPADKIP